MGGVSVRVNNAIMRAGFQPREAYDNTRPNDGTERRWKPGPKIDLVIESLKKAGA